ncbi:MAG: hypothetical protein ACXITV_12040 [Luteibaculaceae bacterium]
MSENTKLPPVQALYDKVEQYIDSSTELYKAKAVSKTASFGSSFALWSILAAFGILFFISINFAVSFMLGDYFGKIYYGFLSVAAFYLLILLILLAFKSKIKRYFSNQIVDEAYK